MSQLDINNGAGFSAAQAGRLERLHAASLRLLGLLTQRGIEQDLLQQGIELLAELIGARYGVIGVLDEASQLKQFVYTGLTPEEAAGIGRTPAGRGLLGAVVRENRALRLQDMGRDPRAVGFPPNHPPMKSLLAVPLSYAKEMYGSIYLSEKHDGAPFTEADEQLVTRFAEILALTVRFHRSEAERSRTHAVLRDVAHAVSAVTGEKFFDTLVLDLAKALQMDYVFVGEVSPHDSRVIETIAYCDHGKIADNFEYQLVPTTACGSVQCKTVCFFPAGSRELYPEDELLKNLQVEAFIGYPLFDATGGVLGLLAVMHGKSVADLEHIHSLLQICAARASAELERHRADRARWQTEADMRKLSSAVEQAGDAIVITDVDGFIEYVNPAFEANSGWRRTELIGRTPALVKSGQHDKAFYRGLWQTLKRGEVFRAVFINRRKDGSLFYEEKTITPLKDTAGRTTHFVSAGRDITERMHAEQLRQEQEERFRQLAENIREVFWLTTPEKNQLLYVSAAYEEIWGRSRAALYNSPREWLDAIHPEDRDRVHTAALTKQATSEYHEEYRVLRPDGSIRWILDRAFPIRNAQGEVYRIAGIAEDVTERRLAEDTLRVKTEQLQAIADAMTQHLQHGNWNETSAHLLRTALHLTQSEYGFAGVLTEAGVLRVLAHQGVVWDEAVNREFFERAQRAYAERGYLEFTNLNNLFGRVITDAGPLIANEPATDPRAGGLPPGHPPLRSFLGVPIVLGHEVVGMIGVANRAGGYTAAEQQRLEVLTQTAGVLYDSYRRQLREQKYTDTIARLGRIVDSTSNEIYIFDADSLRFVQVNQGAQRNLGYSMQELRALTPLDLKPELDRASLEALLDPLRRGKQETTTFTTDHRRKDGSRYPVEIRLQLLRTETPPVFVAMSQDISERREAEKQLAFLAYHDALTGLPNRALLLDRLQQALIEADRVHRVVAVLFLDLDRFKVINDTLGHSVGDGLLMAVAQRLSACLRRGDTVARLGGDEFTVVLANVAQVDDVARVARKLLACFEQPFHVGGRELYTSASIGITIYPHDVRDPEGLLKNADVAMYHAKEHGRDNFEFFTTELNVRAERRLAIETGLRKALARDELSLHYQPQVALKTGRITGMEALARWHHAELGKVPPAEFIAIAEETGLILPIGEWVLREACRQIRAWHAIGFPELQIAVNLSSKQLMQKDFPARVQEILAETGLAPQYLDLELTEGLLMADAEGALDSMRVLHDLGISFSVDDFGTGYSSLAYLKRFPIDILKIDRNFVRDLATDPNDVAIVKAIIAMAHTLGMRVVAEGVETHDQLAFLRAQGCDSSQGYYCSAPIPAHEFSELLQDWNQVHAGRCRMVKPPRGRRKAKRTRDPRKPRRR